MSLKTALFGVKVSTAKEFVKLRDTDPEDLTDAQERRYRELRRDIPPQVEREIDRRFS